MGATVPNQNVVVVHRDMPTKGEGNLLLIKKRNLYEAYKRLKNGYAVCLYLYLVANQEGYKIAYQLNGRSAQENYIEQKEKMYADLTEEADELHIISEVKLK